MKNTSLKINNHGNGIVQITMNKPEIHNAFNEYLIDELIARVV